MRGTDEAGGHAARAHARPPARAPGSLPGSRRDACAEGASKRSQALPARIEGNLGDGTIGIAEQRSSALNAAREQVAMRR